MSLVYRLLRKNTSPARIVGFILSNFIGLAIIICGVQFYEDAKTLWKSDDSFIKTDYLVVNKRVTSANTWNEADSGFTSEEIADLRSQPWVRDIGEFSSTDYRVWASVGAGDKGMSTMMFFESIPDKFVDGAGNDWHFNEGDREVPIIISKDYLALYNFGFAGSAGLPQMSESVLGNIPLRLSLSSFNGGNAINMDAHVVGYSNRLNTILVPQSFMDWSNRMLGKGEKKNPSRLIIDVSSPGDVAIPEYLKAHSLEVAGDKSGSSASFLLKVVAGIIVGIGVVITLLSFFVLLLSISLLMEENRDKLHSLLMLGYPLRRVATPYINIVVWSSLGAFVTALVCGLIVRGYYLEALKGMGAGDDGWWRGAVCGLILVLLLMAYNVIVVVRRVRDCWRISKQFNTWQTLLRAFNKTGSNC